MATHAEILERYLRLRKLASTIQNNALGRVPNDVFDKGASELGLKRGKALVLRAESESAVLADHCIYDVLKRGKNVVERYLDELEAAPGSDEAIVHQAIRDSRYTFILVGKVFPGIGIEAQDVFYKEKLLVADIGFSRSVRKNLWIATRLLVFDDFAMTTGAALPLALTGADEARELLGSYVQEGPESASRLSREKRSQLATCIIKGALAAGASESAVYGKAGSLPTPVTSPAVASPRVGRNDPGPCGSGKKFKRCCGR